jgi:hypothetical protein
MNESKNTLNAISDTMAADMGSGASSSEVISGETALDNRSIKDRVAQHVAERHPKPTKNQLLNRPRVAMNREQIIAAIQEYAQKLGRKPTMEEFTQWTRMSARQLFKAFDTWAEALEKSGFAAFGPGRPIPMRVLFENWASVVRDIKKVPTAAEYRRRGAFSLRVFRSRFGLWGSVVTGMREFAIKQGADAEWKEAMEVIDAYLGGKEKERREGTQCLPKLSGLLEGRPVYGRPLMRMGLVNEPTNEAEVLFLFGMMARDLGFEVIRLQAQFPDCEAYYEIVPGKVQLVRAELEFESRNFLDHGHRISGADMIVCWRHNWPECPLRVVELRKALSSQQSAFSIQHSAFSPEAAWAVPVSAWQRRLGGG